MESIRIRTTPGSEDKFLKINLTQSFDQLEILSLKINQDKLYTTFSSDYGVLVGRVIANEGKGVANARVSVFLPVSEEDKNNPRFNFLYPFEKVTDKNTQGIRYNLLPKNGRYIKVMKTVDAQAFPSPPTIAPQGLIDLFAGFNNSIVNYSLVGYWGTSTNGPNTFVIGQNPNYGNQILPDAWHKVDNPPSHGGHGVNCNGQHTFIGGPNNFWGGTSYGGTDHNYDGFYSAVYIDAGSKLTSLNLAPNSSTSPLPQNTFNDNWDAKLKWNEWYYVTPSGYTLYEIIGKSAITFNNLTKLIDGTTANTITVDVQTYIFTLSKCKYKAVQPTNFSNQINSWKLISDNTDPITGGSSTWECIIDIGIGNGPPVPVGTFPNSYEVLDNDDVLEIYEKYYKYTTRTNAAGDYMIFGVPVGNQVIHMDVDLSDIGKDTLTANEMQIAGIPASLFNGNDFKHSQDLDTLPQIISENASVNIIPLWGDSELSQIGITRYDFKIQLKANPTAVLFFAYGLDNDVGFKNYYDNSGDHIEKSPGKLSEMTISSDGAVPRVYTTKFSENYGTYSSVSIKEIDTNGGKILFLPCDQDKVITDEFGNTVLSNDPNKGIGTTGRFLFDIKVQYSDLKTRRDQFLTQQIMHVPQGTSHRVFKFKAGRRYTVKQQMQDAYILRYSAEDFNAPNSPTWTGGGFPQLSSGDYVNGFIYFGAIDVNKFPSWLGDKSTYDSNVHAYVIDVTDYFDDIANANTGLVRLLPVSTLSQKINNITVTEQDGGTTVSPGTGAALNIRHLQLPGVGGSSSEFLFLKGVTTDRDIFKEVKKYF